MVRLRYLPHVKVQIILFAFDSADDLIKIGEAPILLDNSEAERKVDPKKFLEYISKQIVDEIHVLPLTFSEFFSVYNGSKEEAVVESREMDENS
jgi:hypothetical protein